MSASQDFKPAHGGYPGSVAVGSVATTAPSAKVVSLQTLAQAELEKVLKHAVAAVDYIERLTEAAPESTDIKSLANVLTYSVAKIQAVESALCVAVKYNDGEVSFFK